MLFILTIASTLITIIDTAFLSISRVKVNKKPILKYLKSIYPKLSFSLYLIDLVIQQLSNYILINLVIPGISHYNSYYSLIIVSGIYTYLSIYIDMLGKSVAIMYPDYFCNLLGYLVLLVYYIFFPISSLFFLVIDISLRLFGIEQDSIPETIGNYREEIKLILQQINQMNIVNPEIQMIENIFELKETNISTIMVPRNEFCKIQYAELPDILGQLLNNAEYRFIVVEKGDDIIGYIDFYELLQDIIKKQVSKSIDNYIKEPIFILESSNIFKIIQDMKNSHNNLYFVINEYGTVLGLLTMSDLFDELIGAHYNEDLHLTKTKNGIVIKGIQNIRILNKYLNWNLPEKFLTISGLLLNKVRRIPNENEKIVIQDITFTVLNCSQNKILNVLATIGNSYTLH